MSTLTTTSIMTNPSIFAKGLVQADVQKLSIELGDEELAITHLVEALRNLSTTHSEATKYFTVRFKILDNRIEDSIRHALDEKGAALFLAARPPHLHRIACAEVKQGILWIRFENRKSCKRVRDKPWMVQDFFANLAKASQKNVPRGSQENVPKVSKKNVLTAS